MSENFVVSARKYRPSTFSSVVGQNHITDTLKKAILSNHLAQAYLFTGPRGVGKTTCARILAKAINCENLQADGEPCNECNSCKTFIEQRSMNIFELDAASNNSVEDIRSLVEQVRFSPQAGKYKTYIIDEVHMLSSQAFNAFLKTLEEPPPYAIFILATTEKHKIIPTILSRCQINDFNRIQVKDIAYHLKYIAEKENIKTEEKALHIIAQKADGALRDALTIFDRIVSFTLDEVSYDFVVKNLNIIDYEYFFKSIQLITEKNIAEILLLFDELLNKGFEGQNYLVGLSNHLRNLLVSKLPKTDILLDVPETVKKQFADSAKSISKSFILSSLNIINQFILSYKESKNQRLHTELALIKLCHINDALDLAREWQDQKKNLNQ
jgi:DNA polymerase-3 subunit gamma/tau